MTFKVPEQFRVITGAFGTKAGDGFGAFEVVLASGQCLRVIASAGMGWEHVSVSTQARCPTWEEMCEVKAMFWDDEDCVVQYHPPKSDYVNVHPCCLHLWRPIGEALPRPPKFMVG